jgi:RimJ/RimL family protein N-acetyltransferase/GNAT superfamily N-acetyltransferase
VNSKAKVSGHSFPDVTLETPRLLLRPYRAEDAPEVALACRDELMQRWLPLPNPYTDADAFAWCTEISPGFRTSGEGVEWAAVRRVDGRLIGSFGLKRTDWRGRTSEVGYWIAPWARGEGLAVEGVTAVARWLLLEQRFERLALRAAPGNVASQGVAVKAGFTRECIARNAGFTNDGRVDLVVFSLIPSDLNQADVENDTQSVRSFAPRRDLPPGPSSQATIHYAWRGPFDNSEVNHLHAEAFAHPIGDDDWRGQSERHSLGWVCAREAGELVGWVNVAWDGGTHAIVLDTMVAARARRGGIGAGMVILAAEHAREAGCEWLHVDFDDELEPFYIEACGFTPTPGGLIAL